ncbi:MAG TPA: DUF1398 family protein [Acidocella sp.]|jgi:uncharacterized protein YbcV (DUF1398 family)|uniref:DUF1398 domain-containing protein n=1 Tax=Acidocella sp. TaxID=50710 RepID=UPI002CC02C41|nr:DUF1398 family protein [Acidocella sp.]HVE21468.1 DUF1398 family protein [Acidocella sp.]
MDHHKKSVAKACLKSAEDDSLTFPQIVGTLIQEGFEGYAIDLRRALATYYMPDGDSVDMPMHKLDVPIAPAFDAARVQIAIREAQQLAPGYTYLGFCRKVAAAGCAGYMVSFSGRRALYFGRTAETHVEYFPD